MMRKEPSPLPTFSGKLYCLFILLLWLWVWPALSQDLSGPVYPCPGCEERQFRPDPVQAMWYNPEQPGTGMTFTIRNHHLVGTWYGYDAEGYPEWLLFDASMQPGDTPEILWTVDADLKYYQNGSCPTCQYQPPQSPETVGQIHIEFDQIAHARFSVTVNGETSPVQNIVPLRFGGTAYQSLGEGIELPDMTGQWLMTTFIGEDPGHRQFYVEVTEGSPFVAGEFNNQPVLLSRLITGAAPEDLFSSGSIFCFDGAQSQGPLGSEPHCVYRTMWPFNGDPVYPLNFALPVGDLTHDRFFSQTGGNATQALRINFHQSLSGDNQAMSQVKLGGDMEDDLPNHLERTMPTQGMWFNPLEPGTGLTFYVENGHLGGTYYGYDEQGKPVWWLFNQRLIPMYPGGDSGRWSIDNAPLQRFSGGSCLGCSYQAPHPEEGYHGTIDLYLPYKSGGHFTIQNNSGRETKYIIAGSFGGIHRTPLADDILYAIPDLAGTWAFTFKPWVSDYPGYLYGVWDYRAYVVEMDSPYWLPDGTTLHVANVHISSATATPGAIGNSGSENVGELQCTVFPASSFGQFDRAQCYLNWDYQPSEWQPAQHFQFTVFYLDIEENSLFGETPQGDFFHAHKITSETPTLDQLSLGPVLRQ